MLSLGHDPPWREGKRRRSASGDYDKISLIASSLPAATAANRCFYGIIYKATCCQGILLAFTAAAGGSLVIVQQ